MPRFNSYDMNISLTESQKILIEKVGVNHERSGLQPAPARVASLLLVCDEPELTFDNIRELLNLSKSAASNAINLLLSTERITYITKPGDRKRYFRSKLASWKDDIKRHYQDITETIDLLKEVLHQRPGDTTEFNQNLKDAIGFMEYLNAELPKLYEKWERSKG